MHVTAQGEKSCHFGPKGDSSGKGDLLTILICARTRSTAKKCRIPFIFVWPGHQQHQDTSQRYASAYCGTSNGTHARSELPINAFTPFDLQPICAISVVCLRVAVFGTARARRITVFVSATLFSIWSPIVRCAAGPANRRYASHFYHFHSAANFSL